MKRLRVRLLWTASRLLIGISIIVVALETSHGTWEQGLGFSLCAVATVLLSRGEWAITRKLGWTTLAIALVLLAIADLAQSRTAQVALYIAAGASLVAAFLLLGMRAERQPRGS